MTITETIWAAVYSAEYQRLMSDWVVAARGTASSADDAPAAVQASYGVKAAAQADAAVANIPEATQAALAARILALKP